MVLCKNQYREHIVLKRLMAAQIFRPSQPIHTLPDVRILIGLTGPNRRGNRQINDENLTFIFVYLGCTVTFIFVLLFGEKLMFKGTTPVHGFTGASHRAYGMD